MKISPSFQKVPLVVNSNRVNPVHSAMLREIRQSRTVLEYPANGEEVLGMLEGMLERRGLPAFEEKAMLIYEYYLLMTMRYLRAEEADPSDLNAIHSAFLLHSLLLVLGKGEEDLLDTVEELREEVIVGGHYLWVTNNYLASHNSLPLNAKRTLQHFRDLIISRLLWEESNDVAEIAAVATSMNRPDSVGEESLSIREANLLDQVDAILTWGQSRS